MVNALTPPRPDGDFALAGLSTRSRLWLLTVACFGVLLVISSMVALNTALPDIATATSATQSQLTWIVDSYTLVLACLLLPAGALGDRYGRRGRDARRSCHIRRRIVGTGCAVRSHGRHRLPRSRRCRCGADHARHAVTDHRGSPKRSAEQGSWHLGRCGRIRRGRRDARIRWPAELLVVALHFLGVCRVRG